MQVDLLTLRRQYQLLFCAFSYGLRTLVLHRLRLLPSDALLDLIVQHGGKDIGKEVVLVGHMSRLDLVQFGGEVGSGRSRLKSTFSEGRVDANFGVLSCLELS